MARLLVVSRSMALALRLADTHDVVEGSVEALAGLTPPPDVDAVVLDVGEPALAIQTVDRLRRAGDATPLLVVSGYQPEWAGLTAVDVPGVVVVPLPVTRAALLDGIDRLVAGPGGPTSGPETGAIPLGPPRGGPITAPIPRLGDPPSDPGATDRLVRPYRPSATAEHPVPASPVTTAAPVTAAAVVVDASPGASGAPGAPDDGWHGNGFDWWTDPDGAPAPPRPGHPVAPAAADVLDEPLDLPVESDLGSESGLVSETGSDSEADADVEDSRPLRRGWPPRAAEAPAAGTAPEPAHPAEPEPPVEPHDAPGVRESFGGSLLGRPAHGGADMAEFRRRLGGRAYTTSLGPGGTSPELVALGATGAAGPDELPVLLGLPDTGDRSGPRDGDLSVEHHAPPPAPTAPWAQSPAPDGRPATPLPPESLRLVATDLVKALLDRIGDVVSVAEAAQAVADRAVAVTGSAACAVLVPDGDLWRVAGGVGLRELERRLVIDRSHRLVELVEPREGRSGRRDERQDGSAGRPVVLDDTDAVRQRPGGLPLAGWRYLLAGPVPAVRAFVLLARGADAHPFGPPETQALREPLADAAPLLQAALHTRHLARLLAPLRDLPRS